MVAFFYLFSLKTLFPNFIKINNKIVAKKNEKVVRFKKINEINVEDKQIDRRRFTTRSVQKERVHECWETPLDAV